MKVHQAACPMRVKSLIFFSFFWLASRLGPDYEALDIEGLNF
jgi:hypothetical protein